MFDPHAQSIIDALPRLPQLEPAECRRTLSRAYLLVVGRRIGAQPARPEGDHGNLTHELRRMADALESVAVFDVAHGVEVSVSVREASAFVAAEALALLSELAPAGTPDDDPVRDPRVYAALESGLLYMIGGFDINAVAAVSGIAPPIRPQGAGATRVRAGSGLVERVLALCRGILPVPTGGKPPGPADEPGAAADVHDHVARRLYQGLSGALDAYFGWLAGRRADGLQLAQASVRKVRAACAEGRAELAGLPIAPPFAEVSHLAGLLAAAIDATQGRSVVHAVPPPTGGAPEIVNGYRTYLGRRARGSVAVRGRPLLWPSALEYVRECLPGPCRDAVVSMPTGSGKSFVAELAVSHALARGWVLYLAPTNALAHQIRRDLRTALAAFDGVEVTAFVGGEEYSALDEDALSAGRTVSVMTPEKCALALRLYPETFASCALCVFDECHLLNDEGRGVVADILMAQLFSAAPQMRVLLMSAMVANPDELQGWLASVRAGEAHRSAVAWRPSRAARGFVFLDKEALDAARDELALAVPERGPGALSAGREVSLGWLMGLSGPWTRDGSEDYAAARLPLSVTWTRRRTRKGAVSEGVASWKNPTGRILGEMLAGANVPTIDFIMSSRHHAFGQAAAVTARLPGAVGPGPLPALVEAQLRIADAELGVASVLRDLLQKGVAVHTSAMLQVEQAAAERMFADGGAKLMFATGTLAQGLNLPAAAVIVSGSKFSGPTRPDDAADGIARANSLILNGFGRAGRPGFANQAVVLLVSDEPFTASVRADVGGSEVLNEYPVLGEADASVLIRSPVERFLDELLAADEGGGATALDLALTTLLSSGDGPSESAGAVLRRTFAGWRLRERFGEAQVAEATRRLASVRAEFLEGEGVPPWMATAALKAGVGFFRAQRMWQALLRRGLLQPQAMAAMGIMGWFELLLDVLAHLPVRRVAEYLNDKKTVTPSTRLFQMSQAVSAEAADDPGWTRPDGWAEAWAGLAAVVRVYMSGGSYARMCEALYGTPATEVPAKRGDGGSGLPPVFKFVGDLVGRALAIDAGLLLALVECWLEAEHPVIEIPDDLQALPLCVRNGCDSAGSLAWFRFGFRQRVCAHALTATYPLPPDASTDGARAAFVREARQKWLEDAPGGDSLLDSARTVVAEGSVEGG